jgi:integrase
MRNSISKAKSLNLKTTLMSSSPLKARTHVMMAKTQSGKRYSHNTYSSITSRRKGALVFEDSTKITSGERIQLPLVQPSPEILVDVARFLKKHIAPKDRLLECYPDTIVKWWRQIAKECDFNFLHPHAWKHSYATIGALHLHDWYRGNPYFLQKCCLHSSFRTTEKYINQVSNQFLKAFARK